MEHVIQFGVSIDDDAIQKRIVENAEKVITEDIKKEVMGMILKVRLSNVTGHHGLMTGARMNLISRLVPKQ